MSEIDGKYMVNLEGEESWTGWMFDTAEEAIEEAKKVLSERDLDSEIFGDDLGSMIRWREEKGNSFPEEFMLGKVITPAVPLDLGADLIERLDENYWDEYTFDDDYIAQYAFSDGDIEELNKMLYDFIKPKVDKSGYYIVDVMGKSEKEAEK